MLRRDFLAGGAGAVLAAGIVDHVGAGERAATSIASLRIARVPAPCLAGLLPGEALSLRRMPDDAFDPLSIVAFSREGNTVGRFPGRDCRILARLMDAGLTLEGRIVTVTPGERGAAVTLNVYLLDAV